MDLCRADGDQRRDRRWRCHARPGRSRTLAGMLMPTYWYLNPPEGLRPSGSPASPSFVHRTTTQCDRDTAPNPPPHAKPFAVWTLRCKGSPCRRTDADQRKRRDADGR